MVGVFCGTESKSRWEIYNGGAVPYSEFKNEDVAKHVMSGSRLDMSSHDVGDVITKW